MVVKALEVDFPAALISLAAEKEAWRKEVHRPASHTHKWWAQRLGTVFRGILASAVADNAAEAAKFYETGELSAEFSVLDPFAGSGTTAVEAVKLGCRAVSIDINPVASLVQRQAVADWSEDGLSRAYAEVERKVKARIESVYRTESNEKVLYYFWVAIADCPLCPSGDKEVELFSSFVFARHAYARKYPVAQATCPTCHRVITVNTNTDSSLNCPVCGPSDFQGPVSGSWMTCRRAHRTKVLRALNGTRPRYRLYAKLVLGDDGAKRYESATDFDHRLYAQVEDQLKDLVEELPLPTTELEPGYNTKQAMSWGFKRWRDFFNDRQLLTLGLLSAAIKELPYSPEKEAMATLFSGVLEFNNLFCSYKGEGTGAVRHMFSNHVLKPERTPLEANPWGTSQSSGAFSTLYQSRIGRALTYKKRPHDIVDGERVFHVSRALTVGSADCVQDFESGEDSVLIKTADGGSTGLTSSSIDLVITDPPYFDNVHYSELADFFHAWLARLSPFPAYPEDQGTTRDEREVQSTEAEQFSRAIERVWSESSRVMREDGLLAFTFHHSKLEGWEALVRALRNAALVITAVQPVKGEMSVAAPKSGARNPSNLDSIVVCRKPSSAEVRPSIERAIGSLREIRDGGTTVGWSDVQSVVRGVVMAGFTDASNAKTIDELSREAILAANDACSVLGLTQL